MIGGMERTVPAVAAAIVALAVSQAGCRVPVSKFQPFDEYGNARELCTLEKVTPAPGFTWWFHLTTDAPETVAAFYRGRHGRYEGTVPNPAGRHLQLVSPMSETLSVYDLSKPLQLEHAVCDQKPGAEDRTLIVVVNAYLPARRTLEPNQE
jgi:hypothetical protein